MKRIAFDFFEYIQKDGWEWSCQKFHFFKMIESTFYKNEPAERCVIEEYALHHVSRIKIFNGGGNVIYYGKFPKNARDADVILQNIALPCNDL